MIKKLQIFFFLLLSLTPFVSKATHIVGGSLTYVHISGSTYVLTLKLYRDCGPGTAGLPASVDITILDNFGQAFNPTKNVNIPLTSVSVVPSSLDPCAVAPNPQPCVQEAIYTKTVTNLPPSVGGYQMYYQICCRNNSILNITNPGGTGETFYATIPGMESTSIWNEDFTLPNGTTVDNGATSWSLVNGTTAPSSSSVTSNLFQINGANNASAMWYSQVIPISTCTNVNISIKLSETGALDANDSIKVYYKINGGPLTLFPVNGSIVGNFTNAVASATGLSGSNIQIVIRTKFDGSSPTSENYQFDNVNVTCVGSFIDNSDPTFDNFPPLFICVNQPFIFDHSATDINGDQLVYSLYQPFNNTAPTFASGSANFTPVVYNGSYSFTNPLGGPLAINPTTGILSGTPSTLGQFVVGVVVSEYRNGVLISQTLRDFQFNVLNCPQPPPSLAVPNSTINNGCAAKPVATGITSVSATWNSISPGVSGAYNNYLSCTSGCLNNTVSPVGTPPPYVDFVVCGVSTSCAGNNVCDTFRVNFNSALAVNIFPSNPTLCFGQTSTTITANGVGGTAPYNYLWNNVNPSQTINVGIGTYNVQLSDGSGCPPVFQAVTVTAFTTAITANAGNNQTKCKQTPIATLNGTITGAPGGIWTGGAGSFVPNNTTLSNVTYSPSAAELLAGTVTLTLTSTGNGSCPPAFSTITITYVNFTGIVTPTVTNPTCFGQTNGSANPNVTGGFSPYTYNWTTSPTQTTSTANNLSIGTYSVVITDAIGCKQTTVVTVSQPPVLAINSTFTNVACFGGNEGAISLSVVGGTPTYSYTWSPAATSTPSLTGLIAGAYSVTVIDIQGCIKTANFTITQPATLTMVMTQTNINCYGGNNGGASSTVSGGTSPFSYNWIPNGSSSPSITGAVAGNYTLEVTDNLNCKITTTIAITQPSLMVAVTSVTNETCSYLNNGAASVSVTGGTGPFSYSWSPGAQTTTIITNKPSGNYIVYITDSKGCVTQQNALITEPQPLTVSIVSPINVLCFGTNSGSAYASPGGGTPNYSYLWSPGGTTNIQLTNAIAGTYTVLVTDNQACTTLTTVTITQPTSVTITTSVTNVTCNGGSNGAISLTTVGGSTPYTYFWANGGQTTSTINALIAGNYPVNVTDNNGCLKSLTLTVIEPTAITVAVTQTNVSCFGGSNGTASALASGGTAGYTYSWQPTGQLTNVATALSSNTYTVIVKDNFNCIFTKTVSIVQPAQLLANVNFTNETCNYLNNGTAVVIASGGTAGYTYSWLPSGQTTTLAINLSSGTHSVIVTDTKSCVVNQAIVIAEPAPLAVAFNNQINVSCFGGNDGSIGTTPSGGTPNYTYSWSPSGSTAGSLNSLTSGIYSLTLKDNNNCVLQNTISITQPTLALSVSVIAASVTCNNGTNGSASGFAIGGTSSYTYAWAPNALTTQTITNLSSGTYTLKATDSKGCISSSTIFVSQPAPIVPVVTTTNAVCNGTNGAASVSLTGGVAPYTYQWLPVGGTNTLATGLSAGIYSISITDNNGCNKKQQFNINNTGGPIVTIYTVTNVSCFGGSDGIATASVTGGSGLITYTWTPYGGNSLTATGLVAGSYNITVVDANGCQALATTNPIINQPTVIVNNITTTNVNCFGGATGSASVTISGGTPTYSITWLPSNTSGNSVAGLSAGIYSIQTTDLKNCTQTTTYAITQPTAPLLANASGTNVLCNGGSSGSAYFTASGGTSPYSYNWMPGNISGQSLSNVSIGSFTATVTDIKNCVSTTIIAITEPPIVALTPASINSNCGLANGQTSVAVTGGTGLYTYTWSPSGGNNALATNLLAGNYSVTVKDANNCKKTTSIIVNDNPSPLLLISSTTSVSCFGGLNGTATATVTGGTGPFTYTWSPIGGNSSTSSGLSVGVYTVAVTSANGCLVNANSPIITGPSPIFKNIQTNNVSCFGGSNGSATITAGGGTPGYTFTWLTTNSTGSVVTGLSVGIHSVTITDANSCSLTQTFSITQPLAALAASATSSAVSCFGGSNGTATVIATGGTSPYIFNWQPTNSNSNMVSGLVFGTYTILVTDSKSCTTSTTVLVSQPTQSISLTTNSAPTICFGGSDGTATVTAIGGNGSYTYSWSPITATTSIIVGLSPGNYNVTVSDVKNCQSNASVIISTPSPLNSSLTHIDAACGLANGSIASQVNGGQGPYTYSWSPNAATTPTAGSLLPNTYTLIVKDFYGCVKSATTTLVNIPSPSLTVVSTTNVACFGQNNGSATINISQGTLPYNLNWLPYGGNTVTANQLSAGIYTATVTDGRGCLVTKTVSINEPLPLAVSVNTIINVSCFNGNNGSINLIGVGGTPAYSYTWTPLGAGNGSFASNLVAGNYTISVEDSQSCKTSMALSIIQPSAALTATISNIITLVCFNSLGSATSFASGGTTPYTYTWTTNPIQNGSTATILNAGNFTVNISDANGCASSNTLFLTQPSQVVESAGLNDTICLGQTASISSSASGGAGNYYYVWQPGTTINSGTLTPSPTANTTYTVVAFDQYGCASVPDYVDVEVHTLNASNIQVNGISPICPAGTSLLSANVMGNTGAVTYTWSNGLGSGPGTFIVSPSQPMYYYVTVTNNCGLTRKDSVYIDFYPLPTVLANPNASFACVPYPALFMDNSTAGTNLDPINGWAWDFGDGESSNLQNPDHVYSNPGTYTVTLTVTTDAGCKNSNATSPIVVNAYPSPVAQFSVNSNTFSLPYDGLICTNLSTGAVSYNWNFGDGNSSSQVHPHYTYSSIGNYQIQLVAMSVYGCSDTAYTNIVTDADVVFPNAFTPNADNNSTGGYYVLGSLDNDIFFPYSSGVIDYKLQIFNRWGELVFETSDIKQGWDGYYKGKISQLGVYIWKAYVKLNNNKVFNKTGDVTLLR